MQTRLFVSACLLLAAQLGFGQTFGSISGETRDSSGAIVAGAAVTAVNAGTNATRTVATNEVFTARYVFGQGGEDWLQERRPESD